MKKIFYIIIICLGFLFVSCEEDFSPYGEFKDRYALTCILKSDTTFQTAVLMHNYKPDGFDPYTNTNDPAVLGADIRVWYNDSVYVFRDTSVVREDTARYNTPFHFYYNNQFKVANQKSVEVEVVLQGGKRLNSSSVTPREIIFDDKSDVIIPVGTKSYVQFLWTPLDEGNIASPRLAVRYKQKINGQFVEKVKDLPNQYFTKNGVEEPYYPPASSSAIILYQVDAITKSLQEISEGDPDKQNYYIYQNALFDLVAFDIPVSRYVSSTSGSVDDLTVTVDVSDYTNIEGGLGIFGSYTKKKYTRIRFIQNYIESLGYNFIPEN